MPECRDNYRKRLKRRKREEERLRSLPYLIALPRKRYQKMVDLLEKDMRKKVGRMYKVSVGLRSDPPEMIQVTTKDWEGLMTAEQVREMIFAAYGIPAHLIGEHRG